MSCGSLHFLLHEFFSLNTCLLFTVTNSALSKLSLRKINLFLGTERLRHKIINATHRYNPVTKHGTVIYRHKNELGCAMAKVVAASLCHGGGSSPVHVGMKSTRWQQVTFHSWVLLFSPVSIILWMLHTLYVTYQLHYTLFVTDSIAT